MVTSEKCHFFFLHSPLPHPSAWIWISSWFAFLWWSLLLCKQSLVPTLQVEIWGLNFSQGLELLRRNSEPVWSMQPEKRAKRHKRLDFRKVGLLVFKMPHKSFWKCVSLTDYRTLAWRILGGELWRDRGLPVQHHLSHILQVTVNSALAVTSKIWLSIRHHFIPLACLLHFTDVWKQRLASICVGWGVRVFFLL